MSGYVEWSALGQVIAAGLVVGAGLPVLFALGVRLMTPPVLVEGTQPMPHSPARRLGALVCFGIVGAAVLVGLSFLVAGGH